MRCVIELLDIESVLLELYYSSLVIIDIAIVRSTKYSDYCREFLCTVPFMHLVSIELSFMCAQNREQLVFV